MVAKQSGPTFTPPTIFVGEEKLVGMVRMGVVRIYGGAQRQYMEPDSDGATAVVRALEKALHAEYALLEMQKAIVRRLADELRTRRGTPTKRKP